MVVLLTEFVREASIPDLVRHRRATAAITPCILFGRLDLDDLLTATEGRRWTGIPDGATIGHVHLQVGALPPAEAFYAGVLGLDVTNRYPGCCSLRPMAITTATNIWNSRRAAMRSFLSTGLAGVQIRLDAVRAAALPPHMGEATQSALHDPWGTPISLNIV